jgi:hypothetical protein
MLRRNVLPDGARMRAALGGRRISACLHLGTLCLLVTLEARAAGTIENTTLLTLDLRENGWAVVCAENTKIGPACSAINNNCFAFDAMTDRGRSLQSLITAAFLAGRKADLAGTDACDAKLPDVEVLARFVMH